MACFLGGKWDGYMVLRVSIRAICGHRLFPRGHQLRKYTKTQHYLPQEIVSGLFHVRYDSLAGLRVVYALGLYVLIPQSLLSPKNSFCF